MDPKRTSKGEEARKSHTDPPEEPQTHHEIHPDHPEERRASANQPDPAGHHPEGHHTEGHHTEGLHTDTDHQPGISIDTDPTITSELSTTHSHSGEHDHREHYDGGSEGTEEFDPASFDEGHYQQHQQPPQMTTEEYMAWVQSSLAAHQEPQEPNFHDWEKALAEQQVLVEQVGEEEGVDAGWWFSADRGSGGSGRSYGSYDSYESAQSAEDDEGKNQWRFSLYFDEEDSSGEKTRSTEETPEEEEEADEDLEDEKEESQKPLMGMKSFRYFEGRILANFVKESDDDRMTKIKLRMDQLKKVKPPKLPSVDVLKEPANLFDNSESKMEMKEGEMELTKTDFTAREWALASAISFLKVAGCKKNQIQMSKIPEDPLKLSQTEYEKSTRLVQFHKTGAGKRRRTAIGSASAAPQIDKAFQRVAERSMWRSVIDNSKPKYPLPRFILPRHQYLRKIEQELIGPGSYEQDYYEKQRLKRLNFGKSSFQSCTSRFPKEKWHSPGADIIADPYGEWDKACEHYKHPGSVPLFQSTPCNFRYKEFYQGSGLSPAHYNIKSPLEELLKTVKSKRTIYTVGSGEDDSFCRKPKPDGSRLGPGAYDVRRSIVKELTDRYNYYKGSFSQTSRNKMFGFKEAFKNPLWPTENGLPGPNEYNPNEGEDWM